MHVARPDLLPDPSLSTAEMKAQQREVARAARFVDDIDFDPAAVGEQSDPGQTSLADAGRDSRRAATDSPVVAGVDQAFTDDEALSAVVALRDGEVVERTSGAAPLSIPYVPGLLSFREAGAIVDALEGLTVEPDVLFVDGSGRIHFRQAGIATHVGVLFDVPALGVAKSLLCGTPREPLDDPLPAGARVPIEADGRVESLGEKASSSDPNLSETDDGDADIPEADAADPDWPVIGYAFQSRQYPNPAKRHVNPLYVSPGHRLSARTTVDLVERTGTEYKLPEPTRLADAYADEIKSGR